MTDVAQLGLRVDSKQALLADRRLSSLTRTGRGTRGMFGSLSKSAKGLALGLGAAGIAGSVYVLQKAFSASIELGREFQENMSDLEAITGITGDSLERIGEQAIESSKKTTQSAQDVVEAYKLVASQLAHKIDFGTEEGQQQLRQVADDAITLSEAARIDLATAVQATTTALNQFNLRAEDSTEVINNLAAGSKFGAAEVDSIQQAMAEAGSAANAAGEDINTTNAAIQVLAQNAIKGSKAGTGLRNVFLRLMTESERLAEMGIENVDVKSDGLSKTLRKLQPIMNDSSKLVDVFGRRVFNAVSILIKNVDTLEDLEGKMGDTNTAMEQQSAQLDNLTGDIEKLTSSIEGDLITAFNDQRNDFRAAVQEMSELWEQFGDDFISVMNLIVSHTSSTMEKWGDIWSEQYDETLNITEDSLLTTLNKLDGHISSWAISSGKSIFGFVGTVLEGFWQSMVLDPFEVLFGGDGDISEKNKQAMKEKARSTMAAFQAELARSAVENPVPSDDVIELDDDVLMAQIESDIRAMQREAERTFQDQPILLEAKIDSSQGKLVDERLISEVEKQFEQFERLGEIFDDYDVGAAKARLLRSEIEDLVESGQENTLTTRKLIDLYDLWTGKGIVGVNGLKDATDDLNKKQDETGGIFESVWSRISGAYDKAKDDLSDVNSAADQLGFTFESAFENAIIEGEAFRDVLQGVWQDIQRIVLRKTASEPLGNFFSSFLSNLAGGSGSEGRSNNARGGIFSGLTSVRDSSGRKQQFGEASQEGVLPLKRMKNGNLGVSASGGGGETNITIINNTGEETETKRRENANGGEDIEVIIGRVAADNVRRRGSIFKAFKSVSNVQGSTRRT